MSDLTTRLQNALAGRYRIERELGRGGVEDGSHFVARTRLIQEMLGWLDKYQPLPQ